MKKDVVVFYEKGKFGAWPANFLCRAWGEEIIIGYVYATYSNPAHGHHFEKTDPWYIQISRSLDGGKTWKKELTPIYDPAPNHTERRPEILKSFRGNIDFTDPDFVMCFNMASSQFMEKDGKILPLYSWWYYSEDRGHSWKGPYRMPDMEEVPYGMNMRTSYIVDKDKNELFIFGTCQKSTSKQGRVFCAKMTNGGKKLKFLGWIGEELPAWGYYIMPQAHRRADGTMVCLVRTQLSVEITEDNRKGELHSVSQFESSDNGITWKYIGRVFEGQGSNPPALAVMGDGTWVMIVGARTAPLGIRYKYSEDEGRTWSKTGYIRDDGNCGDLGYPRCTTLGNGNVFVGYYYQTEKRFEPHIEGTVFDKTFVVRNAGKNSKREKIKIKENANQY